MGYFWTLFFTFSYPYQAKKHRKKLQKQHFLTHKIGDFNQ